MGKKNTGMFYLFICIGLYVSLAKALFVSLYMWVHALFFILFFTILSVFIL